MDPMNSDHLIHVSGIMFTNDELTQFKYTLDFTDGITTIEMETTKPDIHKLVTSNEHIAKQDEIIISLKRKFSEIQAITV